MINLADKINKRKSGQGVSQSDASQSASVRSATIRDRLLLQELQELRKNLSIQCSIRHPDTNKLHEFILTVKPKEGIWAGGTFNFEISVPEGYNHTPPLAHCNTRIWHPNIDEEGRVCLSLLRQSSLDSAGWAPTRRLLDVVWGIESLFSDLCDFNDALNTTAAEQFQRDPDEFHRKARNYVHEHARSMSAYLPVRLLRPASLTLQLCRNVTTTNNSKPPPPSGSGQQATEIQKYTDPNFIDEDTMSTRAKVELILTQADKVKQTAVALESVRSLEAMLNHPSFRELASLRKRLNELNRKHVEQDEKGDQLISSSQEVLGTYNNLVTDLSKMFIQWNQQVASTMSKTSS